MREKIEVAVAYIGFDVNGVLVDDTPQFIATINMAFRRLGKDPIEPTELRRLFVQPWTNIFRGREVTEEMASDEELYKLYNEIYNSFTPPPLAKGAYKILIELKRKGFKLGIVSTQQKEVTERILQCAQPDIMKLFDVVRHGVKHKSAVLQELVHAHGAVAYVGDQVGDATAAYGAKAIPIIYTGGLHTPDMFQTISFPHFTVNSFEELLTLPFIKTS